MSCCCGHSQCHHQGYCPAPYPPSAYYPLGDFYDQPGPRRRRRRRRRGRGRGPEGFEDSRREGFYDQPGPRRGRGRGSEELEDYLQGLQEEIEQVRRELAAMRESKEKDKSSTGRD